MRSATVPARVEAWGLTHVGRLAYVEERLGVAGFFPTSKQRVRRAFVYVVLTWVIPFALSVAAGRGKLMVPFSHDIEAHVRGLLAVPLLLLAEWPIERRLRAVMRRLGSLPITPRRLEARLAERVHWARRVAGHPLAEGALVALAFAVGYRWLLEHEVGVATWAWSPAGGASVVSPAGIWSAALAVPIYAFLVLRWLWRWVVLAVLFARLSRLPLRLVPNHGDRAAGLGFVAEASVAFSWVLMAMAAVACAKWMDSILYLGASPRSFLTTIQVVVVAGVSWAFFPLLAFVPRLVATRQRALRRYSDIVAKHGVAVERRWVSRTDRVNADDAGSMADLNSVHAAVRAMMPLPATLTDLVVVGLATIAPLTPVAFAIVPARELASRLLQSLV